MRKLAIISCKATKKTYSCKAEEMYSDSPQFKFQIPFINEYYTDYNILSIKYGVIAKDTIIDTYNMTLTKASNLMSKNPTINDISKSRWATKVKKQIAQLSFEWDEIHLHLSEAYLNEIQEVLSIPNVIYIKLPNTLDTKANYNKALEIYKQKDDVFLDVISNYVKWRKAFKYELLNKKLVLPWTL